MANGNGTRLQGLRKALKEKETPMWFTILAFLVATATPFIQAHFDDQGKAQDKLQAEIALQLRTLQADVASLSTLIDTFAYPLFTSGELNDNRRTAVLENLVRQQQRVQHAEVFLTGEQKKIAEQYQETLVNVRDSVRAVRGPMDLRQMYVDVYAMLKSREKLLEALQERSGIVEAMSARG